MRSLGMAPLPTADSAMDDEIENESNPDPTTPDAGVGESLLGPDANRVPSDQNGAANGSVRGTDIENEMDGVSDNEGIDDEEPTHRCGYFAWKPDWLQKFHNPRALLACVCWFAFTQGFVVNGIINVNLATLERRFDLSSAQVAWVSSIYDVTGCVLAMIFGYIGIFVHKGRVLSICALIMGVGSFVMFLPHALSGTYQLGVVREEHCTPHGEEDLSRSSSSLISLLLIGQLLHSAGGASLHTLATSYMDETINIKSTSTYIGIYQSCSVLGPAIAYCLGGQFLNIYVDVGRVDVDGLGLTPRDPRWVGAWWMGFLFSSMAGLMASVFMACFGRELPAARKNRHQRVSQAHVSSNDAEKGAEDGKGGGRQLDCSPRHALASFKVVLTNPVWALVTMAVTVQAGLLSAFGSFLPKIVQFQFSQPPATAALMVGMLAVPGAVGGQLLGGLLPKWLNLKMRGLLLLCAGCSAFSVVTVLAFLLRCQMPLIAGVTAPYKTPFSSAVVSENGHVEHSLSASAHSPVSDKLTGPFSVAMSGDHEVPLSIDVPCNSNCSCSRRGYNPVCGVDGLQYFSPCHAGCTHTSSADGTTVYYDCGCVGRPSSNSSATSWPADAMTSVAPPAEWQVEHGVCTSQCNYLPGFLVALFFTQFAIFMVMAPAQTATIRCVPDEHRPLGVGIQQALLRMCGGIPGPVLLGTLFDSACLMWQGKEGQHRGSCWIYDSHYMAVGMTITLIIISIIKTLCYLAAFLVYKPPPTNKTRVEVELNKEEMT